MIKLVNVHKSYGDIKVLDNINLTFNKSEISVLIGPSGAGKSTLLYVMNKLEIIDSGQVYVDSVNIYDPKVDISKIRKNVGLVFQQFSLFSHLRVLDNITLAPLCTKKINKKQAQVKAIDVLTMLGLENKMSYFPSQLSGGEQQRVSIARALAMEPEVLLLDEPTNSLDINLVKDLAGIIKMLSRKKHMTLVITSHDINFVKEVADRVLYMHNGSIIEDGKTEKIINTPCHDLTKAFLAKSVGQTDK